MGRYRTVRILGPEDGVSMATVGLAQAKVELPARGAGQGAPHTPPPEVPSPHSPAPLPPHPDTPL